MFLMSTTVTYKNIDGEVVTLSKGEYYKEEVEYLLAMNQDVHAFEGYLVCATPDTAILLAIWQD